ncbi:alpha/beta hydrolase [Verrucosispora sp. WMMA2121]|uniref:alpha/beta fold hydrolase n=1 Tax=Verrucosispora sp. WMMA2121 TaxID=3015164 RepID=UPI0022B6716D|nr:alpha/beta hydrolase [Verrucosispora sp. WMMA2121]MCZ7420048.1 alpha/beta hydrolase [Verrucosispora sp. WMMA2121]
MSGVARRTVFVGSAAVVATGVLTAAIGGPAAAGHGSEAKPTVVLVHGAFADASGWNEVVRRLTREGYPVLAPANPLRGVASDSAYLASILATVSGPIVLVGHSYGGVVITNAATGNPNVKALVYVAAFAPDAGDTVFALQTQFPGTKLGEAQLDFRPYPSADGGSVDGYVKKAAFREVFAGDLPRSTTDLMWATQRPGDVHTLQEPSGAPAWRGVRSWYLVARDDNLIPAAAQRFMAKRAGARTVEVRASHVAMISQPKITADLITLAARATA